MSKTYLDYLQDVANEDVRKLVEAHKNYGDSCLKRGGVGLFMMFARKWDRLEKQVGSQGWDLFKALKTDSREEGVIDDIRDLRRYLQICEAEWLRQQNEDQPKLPFKKK